MTHAPPKVTVCVVTYNHARYIARCLGSVLAQLPQESLQILVGDDGSNDSTRGIIADFARLYPGVVIPHFNEKRLGPSGNYRSLITNATGKFIAHLDGDDYWMPGKLIRQIDILSGIENLSAVLANAYVVDANDRPLGLFTSNRNDRIDLNYLLAKGNFLCHGTLLYKSEFKHDILSIPEEFIDYRILIRLAARGDLAYLSEPLMVYRWNSLTSMRATMTSLVGRNYWDALIEGHRLGGSPTAFRTGASRFLEKTFALSLLRFQGKVARDWADKVRAESPTPPIALLAIAVARVPLALLRSAKRKVGTYLFRRISVLYPR